MAEAPPDGREEVVEIPNAHGLHMRPSKLFAQVANGFSSSVSVTVQGQTVNGKSLLGLISLAAECGAEVRIVAEGEDAGEAVAALAELVRAGFPDVESAEA